MPASEAARATSKNRDLRARVQRLGERLERAGPWLLRTLEVAVVLFVGWRFSSAFVNLSNDVAPGREWESNTSWIGAGRRALLDHAELPLWNHQMGTGLPYLADPLSHFFSPLVLVPTLLTDAVDGPRIAVALTMIAAGLSQYYLASVMGLSPPARVFAALAYMMNGHMVARFESGHFAFGLAFPYLALTYALLIKSMQSRHGLLYPVLGGASLAGLLFAGNVYYFVFSLPGFALMTLIYGVEAGWRRRPNLDLLAVGRAVAMGLWGVGFSAIQWLPWLAINDLLAKDADRNFRGSPTILGALRTMFRSDRDYYQSAADGKLAGLLHEYYSYIGVLLIPLLVLGVVALFTPRRRAYVASVALFWLFVLMASAGHNPLSHVYERFPRLYDFRFTSRELGLAMPFAVMLAAFALDALLHFAVRGAAFAPERWRSLARATATLGATLVVAVYGWYALRDVYDTNRAHFGYGRPNAVVEATADWLHDQGDRPFSFFNAEGGAGVPIAYQQPEIKRALAIWGWRLRGNAAQIVPDQPPIVLRPVPRFFIQPNAAPPRDDAVPVAVVTERSIFRLGGETPYAGFVTRSDASKHPESFALTPAGRFPPWPFDRTTKAGASWPSENQVEASGTPASGQDTLLVLETYVPGWRLEVDGKPAGNAQNVGGMLGAEARPGEHTYLFVYDPSYARRGVAITLGTIVVAVLLLLRAPAMRIVARLRQRRVI